MADYSDLLRNPEVAAAPAGSKVRPLNPASPDAAALEELARAGQPSAAWVADKMRALGGDVAGALAAGALTAADAEALLQGLAKQLAGFAPAVTGPAYQAVLRRELAAAPGAAADRTLSNAAGAAAGGFAGFEAALREGGAGALPGLRALGARVAQMRCALNCTRCGARGGGAATGPAAAAAGAKCAADCAPRAAALQRWAAAGPTC
jgi:hypothetical protein